VTLAKSLCLLSNKLVPAKGGVGHAVKPTGWQKITAACSLCVPWDISIMWLGNTRFYTAPYMKSALRGLCLLVTV